MTAIVDRPSSHPNDGSPSRRWTPAVLLAALAVPLLGYQTWTLGAWLLDGPHQVAGHRASGSTSLIAARAWEIPTVAISVVLLAVLAGRCLRDRRLSFDLMFVIALTATVFWDTALWIVGPVWLYSENWLNVNDWWGNAPLVPNPVAGAAPMPIVMQFGMYTGFTFLLVAGTVTLIRRAKHRWPALNNTVLFTLLASLLLVLATLISWSMNALQLWSAGDVPPFLFSHDEWRVSWGEPLYAVPWALILVAIYYFRDDQGRAMSQRGLDRVAPRFRGAVSLLATIALVNLSVIVLEVIVIAWVAIAGTDPYPAVPPSLIGTVCNDPGWDVEAFGQCTT